MFDLYVHVEMLGKRAGYKNMTELCKAAGVPRSTMTELKKGRSRSMSIETAQKFAELLGVPLETIYGTEEKAPTENGERDAEYDKIMAFLLGQPRDRLRGILLSQGAPEEVLAALDHLKGNE